jgi:acetyl-CoA synthetase
MDLTRLLRPKSLALVGGAWCDTIAIQCRSLGYAGALWRVHPTRASTAVETYYRNLGGLPGVPDCVFFGVNRELTVQDLPEAVRVGAGGAVCFASGFAEAQTPQGHELNAKLLQAAAELPFLGPNCFGFVNFLDRVAVWPDQLGGDPVERGVALICQSGAIAQTLMAQQRELPLAYLITVGNQAKVQQHHLIDALLDDPRVTAIGLYVEALGDLAGFVAAAERARERRVPLAVIKSGRSEAAARATLSHTASLGGADRLYDALFERLGIARCFSLAELVETVKALHVFGPLKGNRVLFTGCSGGDMAMTADVGDGLGLDFAPLPEDAKVQLLDLLGDKVPLANPFDFQTYIWYDRAKMERLFAILANAGYDAIGFLIDHPDPAYCDVSSYETALRIFLEATLAAKLPAAAVASLPETLPKRLRKLTLTRGGVPLQGLPEAMQAFAQAVQAGVAWRAAKPVTVLRGASPERAVSLTEAAAKRHLADAGIAVPRGWTVPPGEAATAAARLGFPVALKASSAALLHKTEAGGVALNLRDAASVAAAAARLEALAPEVLVEEMIEDAVAELLLGVTVDPQFGPTLTLGAGGTLTEIVRDSQALLLPLDEAQVLAALRNLRVWPLLEGFRGKPAGDVAAVVSTVLAIARYVEANAAKIVELEINPLLVRPAGKGAVAVDALLRLAP